MPRSIFIDLNVVLDFQFRRSDFASCLKILELGEDGSHRLHLSAHAVTTFAYVLERAKLPRIEQTSQLSWLLHTFQIEPVNGTLLSRALSSAVSDYEDAVVEAAAAQCGAAAIITSNIKDFAHSSVSAYLPAAYLRSYKK